MKKILPILLLLLIVDSRAQEHETSKVQQTIETFFKGFHAQDSIVMKNTVVDGIIAQTIGTKKDGSKILKTEDFGLFLNSILRIPDSVDFQEKILSFNIQIDGAMAHAWTPYEFWYNGTFSHCGVNSFQLFKEDEDWKINYLIDTRHREGCREQ